MKNKIKTYVLLASVLAIWGTIAYKVINGLDPNDTVLAVNDNIDMTFNPKTANKVDTFSIQNVDRDPFLGTLNKTQRKHTLVGANTPKVTDEKSLPIIYNGLVKKQNSSLQVFAVSIKNNQYLLKKGDLVDSVKLVRGNEKQITIRYQNKNLIIKRQ